MFEKYIICQHNAQILFTPPKPKEDEAKVQMDVLAEEMAECKQLSKEREAGYARLQKDIQQLSDRMNAQLETMQQLLGERPEAMSAAIEGADKASPAKGGVK